MANPSSSVPSQALSSSAISSAVAAGIQESGIMSSRIFYPPPPPPPSFSLTMPVAVLGGSIIMGGSVGGAVLVGTTSLTKTLKEGVKTLKEGVKVGQEALQLGRDISAKGVLVLPVWGGVKLMVDERPPEQKHAGEAALVMFSSGLPQH